MWACVYEYKVKSSYLCFDLSHLMDERVEESREFAQYDDILVAECCIVVAGGRLRESIISALLDFSLRDVLSQRLCRESYG